MSPPQSSQRSLNSTLVNIMHHNILNNLLMNVLLHQEEPDPHRGLEPASKEILED